MFFAVIMSHPDGAVWGEHVHAHVEYLKAKEAEGKVRASGPVTGRPLRSGMFIASVADRRELDDLIRGDPFSPAGLIVGLDVIEWKPFIGVFASEVEQPDLNAHTA